MNTIKNIIFYLYIFPMIISILYFIAVKIQDIGQQNKIYSANKFSFIQTLTLCFIPLFNWLLMIMSLFMIFSSILDIIKKKVD